jgi:DNA-binding MltR family transcriptional regulator
MAKLKELSLEEWNKMVETFHEESDRGAAILAGSFVEHAVGQYLKSRIRDKKVADELFNAMGPLSSFSQRIAIAYAFDLISLVQHKDIEIIRKVRNHFAHHPLDTTFSTNDIKQLCVELSMFNATTQEQNPKPGERYRIAYLLSCGVLCVQLLATK